MQRVSKLFMLFGLILLFTNLGLAQQIDYLPLRPLTETVAVPSGPVSDDSRLHVIAWGGDISTLLGEMDGIFKQQGLNFNIVLQNDFRQQVEDVLTGKAAYLRGTMGMVNAAAEVFAQHGITLEIVEQLTYSVGGDAMVVRKGKTLKNIKTVALQLYGPHMDYAANLFKNKGRLSQVTFKYLKELYLPSYDTDKIVDPVSAFEVDPSLDAVMCIIPDALRLTSNGTVGTGAEGSVKGATILLSTKTGSRIIADVYAVRSDYRTKNQKKVQKFAHGLLLAQEAMLDLQKNVASGKFTSLISKSATVLLESPTETENAKAMLGDCEFVGYNGNVAFFTGIFATGKSTSRTLKTLTNEIQTSFLTMGLLSKRVPVRAAGLDFAALRSGLKYATATAAVSKPKFNKKKAEAFVAKKIAESDAVEATSWEEEGTLFKVEITFAPNQDSFTEAQYAGDYADALNKIETFNGALITVEGHADPLKVQKLRQADPNDQQIPILRQRAKNLSFERAQAVRGSFIAFAKRKGIAIDDSQFIAVGRGVAAPKFYPIKTKEQWEANRRVVFLIKQVEAELTEFSLD